MRCVKGSYGLRRFVHHAVDDGPQRLDAFCECDGWSQRDHAMAPVTVGVAAVARDRSADEVAERSVFRGTCLLDGLNLARGVVQQHAPSCA